MMKKVIIRDEKVPDIVKIISNIGFLNGPKKEFIDGAAGKALLVIPNIISKSVDAFVTLLGSIKR